MKRARIIFILSGLLICLSYVANAQGGPPPQGGSTGGPIDGGAIGLLIGAAVYGYSKLQNKEKAEN